MTPDAAETVALQALGWLVANPELLPVFLGATGCSESDLRRRSTDPELLGAVLDFLTMDDAWVVGFCGAEGLPFDAPRAARMALPGGALPDWT